MPKYILPVCVEAILLPFKGQVIYDGLLLSIYNISFGRGIQEELKQIYLEAKQNNQIIFNLGKRINNIEILSQKQDLTAEINELIKKTKKLRGGNGQPAIYSPVFSLVKLSLDLAEKAVFDSLDIDYFYQKLERAEFLLRRIENHIDHH